MQEKIDEALNVIDWIYDQLDGLPVKLELHIPCALYYISMQHANGALALLKLNAPTPAFALARPIYETFMRSIWYSHKATVEERQLAQNDDFPTLSKIVKSLETDPAAANIIKQYENINVLHSYTHGGSYQILNHIDETDLKPNFDEKEVLVLIDWSLRLAIACSFQFCHLIGADEVAQKIGKELIPKYGKNLKKEAESPL